jgi:hypothetical protein|tara:strand:+ start:1991 stop:2152 length:162 start_codon:yes stop_codon:yes gene_type:complete
MIEEALMNYGVLGLWTMTMLGERFLYNKKTAKLIDNNTIALTKVHEVMKQCRK